MKCCGFHARRTFLIVNYGACNCHILFSSFLQPCESYVLNDVSHVSRPLHVYPDLCIVMLRLQPSEIGLTSSDIQAFKQRLEVRRRAGVQVLNGQLFGEHQSHPTVRRGPARSWDEALTDASLSLELCRQAHNKSDSFPIGDDVQDEANYTAKKRNVSGAKNQDSSEALTEEAAGSGAREQSSNPGLSSRRPVGPVQQRQEQELLGGAVQSVILSRRSRTKSLSCSSKNCDRVLECAEGDNERLSLDMFGQLDGHASRHVADVQRRKFRPRSQSDPQDIAGAPDLIQPRRRPPSMSADRHRTCPVTTVCDVSEPSSTNCLAFLGRVNHLGLSDANNISSFRHSTLPAAYVALRNSPSPLDKLAGASTTTLGQPHGRWRVELPFRFARSPESGSIGTRPPISPPAITTTEHDGTESIPRSSPPKLSSSTLSSGTQHDQYRAHSNTHSAFTMDGPLSAPLSPVPSSSHRTTLCRRNAVHRSRGSVESMQDSSAQASRSRSSAPRTKSHSRSRRPPQSSSHLGRVPDPDSLQVTEHALQAQQARFFRAVTQANGGKLPGDATQRWTHFLEELTPAHSDSEDELAAHGPAHRPVSPQGHNTDDVESLPPRASLASNTLQVPAIQFAVSRGGRPLSQTSSGQRFDIPRRPVPALARRSSDQENMDDATFLRFEQERRARLRRFDSRTRQGNTSGYGVDEGNENDATPPPIGRLERLLD